MTRPLGEGVADEVHRFPAARTAVDDVAEEQDPRFGTGRLCVRGDRGKKGSRRSARPWTSPMA